MTLNTVKNGQITSSDTSEHQIQTEVLSEAVAVKALPTNTGIIWVGAKENSGTAKGWPLSPGEQITLDLKGSNLYYTAASSGDKLAWISLRA